LKSPQLERTQVAKPNGYVITPAGRMPLANVHAIEPGSQLRIHNGHIFKVRTSSGEVMEDFGELHPVGGRTSSPQITTAQLSSPNSVAQVPSPTSAIQDIPWITFAYWTNSTSYPIIAFGTQYNVPILPANNADNHLIYIGEWLSDTLFYTFGTTPTLQFGYNGAFGGNYWCISNWYVWRGGAAYAGPENNIAPGTALAGTITSPGQTNGSYNYISTFTGHPSSYGKIYYALKRFGKLVCHLFTDRRQLASI
jgi:hypothetical protein